jgi:hypothetical protein
MSTLGSNPSPLALSQTIPSFSMETSCLPLPTSPLASISALPGLGSTSAYFNSTGEPIGAPLTSTIGAASALGVGGNYGFGLNNFTEGELHLLSTTTAAASVAASSSSTISPIPSPPLTTTLAPLPPTPIIPASLNFGKQEDEGLIKNIQSNIINSILETPNSIQNEQHLQQQLEQQQSIVLHKISSPTVRKRNPRQCFAPGCNKCSQGSRHPSRSHTHPLFYCSLME